VVKNKFKAIVFILIWVLSSSAHGLTLTLGKKNFDSNESISMNVSSRGKYQRDALDLSALKKNFVIFNKRVHHFYDSRGWRSVWVVALTTEQQGELTIPSLVLGNDKTAPVSIHVGKGGMSAQTTVFIKAYTDVAESYVDEQVLYIQKLYWRSEISDGILSEPRISDVLLKRLDSKEDTVEKMNGLNYNVTQRRYAIFPQKSGDFVIPETHFTGLISDRDEALSRALSRPKTKVSSSSAAITVKVKPIQKTFDMTTWLPSQDFKITDKWSDDLPFKAGEPKTQIISMSAQGRLAERLPDLTMPENPAFKIYMEKSKADNVQNTMGILGKQEYKLTYLPLKSGQVIVPEVKVRWWNTKTERPQWAFVKSFSTTVLSGSVSHKNIENNAPRPDLVQRTEVDNSAPEPEQFYTLSDVVRHLPPVEAVLVGLGLFVLFSMYRYYSSEERSEQLAKDIKKKAITRSATNIKQGCYSGDIRYVEKEVMHWANFRWSHARFTSLFQVAYFLKNEDFLDTVEILNRARYYTGQKNWDGKPFWQNFKTVLIDLDKAKPKRRAVDQLPQLFMTRMR
jgi:hypothetical protein